jgi:hypothetical protein
VAGGVEGVQLDGAELEAVAVVEVFVGVGNLGQLAAINSGIGFARYFEVAAHKIGVRVGFNHRYDFGIVLVGKIVVRLGVAAGVDNGHLAAGAHRIRCVGQAFIIKLLNLHRGGATTGEGHWGRKAADQLTR